MIRPPVDGPAGAAFTTRLGGVSAAPFDACNLGWGQGDTAEAVRANRHGVCRELGLDPVRVAVGLQVHGTSVHRIAAPAHAEGFAQVLEGWPDGDGLCTTTPGVGLVALAADCLPVLMWRRDRPGVAAVHAGWRGLVDGVLGAAVAALGDPAATGVAIGAGIGPCCYEVSTEVRDVFAARFGEEVTRGRHVHLAAAAAVALRAAGVPGAGVWTLEACTRCEPERWFSYRRDGARTGRHAGIVWAT